MEEEITDMFKYIKRHYGSISVCVYSAGVAHVATLLEGKTEDWRDMFEVRWRCILLMISVFASIFTL